jgi:hypothetical protein
MGQIEGCRERAAGIASGGNLFDVRYETWLIGQA